MANSVKIKRGSGAPSGSDLAPYELGYRTGTSELYINDDGQYRQVGGTSGGGAVDSIANFTDNRVLTASGSDSINGEVNLTFDGTDLKLLGDDLEMRWGAGQDFKIYVSSDDAYLVNAREDRDIRFMVNDGNGTSGANITALKIDANNVGRVVLPNDNQHLAIGADLDLRFYNNGSASYIQNNNNVLYINQTAASTMQIRNSSSDQDITFSVNDGGSQITALEIDASAAGRIKLPNDNQLLTIGASQDLAMYHNGSNSFIYNANVGDLIIQNNVDDRDILFKSDDGSGGVKTYFFLDGSAGNLNFQNNALVALGGLYGNNGTLNLYNNTVYFKDTSSNVKMSLSGSTLDIPNAGDWSYIKNNTNSGGLRFGTKDSGGTFANQIEISNTGNYVKLNENTTVTGNLAVTGTASVSSVFYGNQIDFTGELNFTGAGNKIIDIETLANSNYLLIRHHNPSGNLFEDALKLTANGGAKLYYNNGLRFETHNAGASVTGYSAASEHFQLNFSGASNSLLKIVNSGWSNATTHDILFNYWQSNIGDYTYLKSAGNSTSGHGIALVGDSVFAVGDTDVETGAVTNSATAPFTDTWFTVNGSGNGVFKGSVRASGNGGFTIGNVADYARIQQASNEFAFLTSGNAYANIYTADVITHGKIIHYGDTDTYMQFSAADTWKVYCGGDNPLTAIANRVYINASGANGLLINNDENNSADSARIFFEGTSTSAIMQQGTDLSFRSGASTGSSSGTERFLVNSSGATAVGNLNVTGNSFMNYGLVVNEGGNDADFRVESQGNAHMLRVDASTNRVGIGTGSPTYTLDVAGDMGVDHVIYHNDDTNTYIQLTNDRIRLFAGGSLKVDTNETYLNLNNGGGGSNFDADKLDGIHASQFLRNDAVTETITSQDWNDYINATEVHFSSVTGHTGSNRPTGAYTWGVALSYAVTSGGKFQLYAPETATLGSATNQGLWYRTGWNTTYRQWAQIWDSTNDGSGSGLDADKLDGQHGSYYYSSANQPDISDITGVIEGTSFSGTYPVVFSIGGANRLFSEDSITFNGSTNVLAISGNTVWHAGNDGGGSGLDADKLDGLQGSSYWTKSGSWSGDLTSNGWSRVQGVSSGGGEFVLALKNGQLSTLIDGSYFAYEAGSNQGGGFYSSTSSNYANAPGIIAANATMLKVQQADGGSASLQSTGDLIVNSGYISGVGNDNLYLRRTTNNDDRITIEASAHRFTVDAVDRMILTSSGLNVTNGVTTGYGVSFTNGNTNFLQYNNATENVLYMRDTTNGAMLQTWGVNDVTMNKPLKVASGTSESALRIDANAARGANRYALDIVDDDTNGRGSVRVTNASGVGMKITTQGSYYLMDLVSNNDGSNPARSCGVKMTSYEGRANGHYHHDANYGGEWFSGNRYAGNMTNWHVGYRSGTSGDTPDYLSRARIMVDTSGNLHADADVVAYSSTIGSDIKLKKNVKDINYGLKDVLDIRAVEFDWKEKREGKHDIGFIAQEIEKIIPEVVNEVKTIGEGAEEGDTHKVVDYAKLTSVLIKAVQEQQQQINELKEKLNG